MIHSIRHLGRKLSAAVETPKVASVRPEGRISGWVLLSYITAPFFLKPNQLLPNRHSNYWEARQIAETFLSFGFGVDVIDWDNWEFRPRRDYAFCVDLHNMERLAPSMRSGCVKILHITGAHWLFQNSAEYSRLLALQHRRGVTLRPRRIVPPSFGIEYADLATTWGNRFTRDTFSYARKTIHRVPVPATALYDWPGDKDYDVCRRRFLWFGNKGMVHKGLDLVLEAFTRMPDYHLTVCGLFSEEPDFEAAYYKELYQTPNIEAVGWVDTDGDRFKEIANESVALIFPSCSEGASGGAVTCMHAGLIPILSYEAGVDLGDFGLLLNDCSVETIMDAAQAISELSVSELEERARMSWEHARAWYTRENHVACYRDFVTNVLGL